MAGCRFILAYLIALLLPGVVRTQERMTDLIPRRATAAVAIRNLEDLQKKGDKFLTECQLDVGIRPSDLFAMGIGFLGLQGAVDQKGSAAILLLAPEKKGDRLGLDALETLLVGVVPIDDLDKIAERFEVDKDELKPGKVMPLKGVNFLKFGMVKGKHLYLGGRERTLRRLAQEKKLSQELNQDQVKSLNEADILVHLGAEELAQEWRNMLGSLKSFMEKSDDPEEAKTAEQFYDALGHARHAVGAIRLDKGFSLNVTAVLNPDHEPTRDLLKTLSPGPGSSGLNGLPDGRVIVAQASHGDGAKSGIVAKVIFHQFLKEVMTGQHLFSAADRPSFVGVFSEIWRQLKGHRAAVYLNPDESKQGLLNLLAILDTEDAGRFVSDLRVLAKMAEGKLDLTQKSAPDAPDIDKLIMDLGSTTYKVREAANNRLRLIGEPALPFLEKALASAELEVAVRAKRLKGQITTVAAERRKELLAKDLPRHVRPLLLFVPKAETRAGRRVDIVNIQLTGADKKLTGQMQQLLGPEWDRLRLAAVGNQVVALLGSDVELLDRALENLDQGKPGLADSPALSTFYHQARPARWVELHGSVESVLGLITPGENPAAQERPQLSSFSLKLEGSRIHGHVFIPFREIKTINKKKRFFF